ncbi:MAG TPA: hypothetical protein VF941_11715 [Clostridia bacterium]
MDPHKQNDQNKAPEINYQQDIHNADIRDLLAEHNEWEDGQWEEGQEPKEPTKPQEPAPVTPPVEQKPIEATFATPAPIESVKEEPKPIIDEEKLTDKMVDKLYDKLSPQTPEEKKDFAAKLKELNEKAAAENREPTYEEALALLGEEVTEKTKTELKESLKKEILEDLNKEVDEEERRQKEAKVQQEETTKKNEQVLHGEWDRQLGILIEQGSIPKVINKDDENDPGMVAQKNLFEALNAYAKEQQAEGKPVSLNLVEAFMSPHYAKLTKQPGKDAPINGARKSVSGNDKPVLNYLNDIHNKDLSELLAEAYEASES